MFRLIAFLSRNRHVFTFLLLEGISFWIIVRFNSLQSNRFGDLGLEVFGSMYEVEDNVGSYFSLQNQNSQLQLENLQLQKELQEIRQRESMYLALLNEDSAATQVLIAPADTQPGNENFIFRPAKVIRQTIRQNYNYLTLDKGSQHGVEVGMGVISPQGVAGKVIRVSKAYSIALSALNLSFNLTLKAVDGRDVSGAGTIGFYEWNGTDSRSGIFRFVPDVDAVRAGDWLVTSGYNTIFPEGIRMGKVRKIEQGGEDGLSVAVIDLATNFSKMGYVYLVKPRYKQTLDSLQTGLPDS